VNFESLRDFGQKTAASSERRNIVARSKREFLSFEAKIEKVWVGRNVEKLDSEGYVGVVKDCMIRSMSNKYRENLPADYFCNNICSIIYPDTYKLLGFKSSIERANKGCRLITEC